MANPQLLYGGSSFFRLVYNGQQYAVREPEGWDKISIKMEREKELYGFNYEFVDPKVTLTFAMGQHGGDLIEGVYNLAGSDGEIFFEFGNITGGEKIVQLTGRLNLNTRRRVSYGIEVQIEKVVFNTLLRTRYETRISLPDTKDLDGKTAPAAPPLTLHLHSKKLVKIGRAEATPQADQTEQIFEIGDTTQYIQPDTLSAVKSELEEIMNMPVAFFTTAPEIDKRFQYIASEAGTGTIKWLVNTWIRLEMSELMQPVKAYLIRPQIMTVRNNIVIDRYFGPTFSDQTIKSTKDVVINFELSKYAEIQKGDELYFFLDCNFNFGIRAVMSFWNGYIEIQQETEAAPSVCTAYRMFDALNNCVHKITGIPDAVVSDFFGPGGCGEKFAITNGYKIRAFKEEKPVLVSLKDLIEGAAPIFNLGVQYTHDATGKQIIRIEPATYFFGSERIMDFEVITDYEDQHEKDVTFNEVEIGYEKFADKEVNTLFDFATVSNWLLPIQTYKAKYTQKTKLIASGDLIEELRRNQFAKTPSTSMSNDDDLFIIAYRGSDPVTVYAEKDEPFDLVEGIVSPSSAYNLRIAPPVILFNHSGQVNIPLEKKLSTDTITNTFTKNNGALRLRFRNDEPCKPVPDGVTIQSGTPIPLSEYNGRNAFYSPRTAIFKTEINYDDLMYLKARILGESGTPQDYGTVGFPDYEGTWRHGYVWGIEYDPVNKKASFTVRVKGVIT